MMSFGPVRIPRLTAGLVLVTLAVYVLQQLPLVGPFLEGGRTLAEGMLVGTPGIGPLVPRLVFAHGQVWRLITYMFLHAGPGHLLFNLITLWFCGLYLEEHLTSRRFAVLYFTGGVGAGLLSAFMWRSSIVGASGAIFALLAAIAWYFPNAQVLIMFVLPVPMRLFVIVAGVMSILFAISETGGNIAHLTHLAGILVGIAFVKFSGPVERWAEGVRLRHREAAQRRGAELRARQDRFFRERVDPILKKVSEEGMESLTVGERRLLHAASRRNRGRWTGHYPVPHDFP
jgi:membrane associated rhomboid family serine protease